MRNKILLAIIFSYMLFFGLNNNVFAAGRATIENVQVTTPTDPGEHIKITGGVIDPNGNPLESAIVVITVFCTAPVCPSQFGQTTTSDGSSGGHYVGQPKGSFIYDGKTAEEWGMGSGGDFAFTVKAYPPGTGIDSQGNPTNSSPGSPGTPAPLDILDRSSNITIPPNFNPQGGSGKGINLGGEYGFGYFQTLGEALSHIVPLVVGFFAAAVLLYIIIAAIKFIVSEGDKNSVSEAKKTITHTIIALLLFILLFLFIKYIPEFFHLGFRII